MVVVVVVVVVIVSWLILVIVPKFFLLVFPCSELGVRCLRASVKESGVR